MLKTALDLVPILEAIDVVKSSKLLTKAQQDTVLREVASAIPAPVFCKQCPETLSIINKLVETTDGSPAKRTSKEETSKAKDNARSSKTSTQKPSGTATSDTRGTGKVPRNAKEPKEQGGKTSRSSRRSQ